MAVKWKWYTWKEREWKISEVRTCKSAEEAYRRSSTFNRVNENPEVVSNYGDKRLLEYRKKYFRRIQEVKDGKGQT